MWADLFLGDLDIGPASSRIYLLFALGVVVTVGVLSGRIKLFSSRLGLAISVVYALFIGWALVNSVIRDAGLVDSVERLGSTIFFGWLLFVLAQASIRRISDLYLVWAALTASAVLNAIVAISQWLGLDAAWDLARLFRPDTLFDRFPAVAGLALFSIPLAYQLLVGGVLLAGALLWWPRRYDSLRWLAGIGLGIVMLGTLFSLSRSAIGIGALALLALVIARYAPHPRAVLKFAVAGVVLLAIAVIVGNVLIASRSSARRPSTYPERVDRFNLSRATSISSPDRWGVWRLAVDSWLKSPLIGDIAAYNAEFRVRGKTDRNLGIGRPRAPHNLLLNSLVIYGAIGTSLILAFMGLVTFLAYRTVRATRSSPSLGPLALIVTVGLIAFTVNAQFHNESFVSGSTLGFWLVAFLVAVENIYRNGEKSQNEAPANTSGVDDSG